MEIRIYDVDGMERTPEWLWEEHGIELDLAVEHRPQGAGGFDLVELREAVGTCGVTVTILDPDGAPLPGWMVARWWPGAGDEELVELPAELQQWHDRGLWGTTDQAGRHTFFMGAGNAYDPATSEGITCIWAAGNCDQWLRAGWIAGTHYRHMDLVFRASVDEPPEPPAGDEVVELLRQILAGVLRIVALLGADSPG